MQLDLKGTKITVRADLYFFMKDRLFTFDEEDCKGFMAPAVTTGDLETGFECPDIDKIIDNSTEEEISKILEKGILLQKRMME